MIVVHEMGYIKHTVNWDFIDEYEFKVLKKIFTQNYIYLRFQFPGCSFKSHIIDACFKTELGYLYWLYRSSLNKYYIFKQIFPELLSIGKNQKYAYVFEGKKYFNYEGQLTEFLGKDNDYYKKDIKYKELTRIGKIQAKLYIADRLLAMCFPTDVICKLTGLKPRQIETIYKICNKYYLDPEVNQNRFFNIE